MTRYFLLMLCLTGCSQHRQHINKPLDESSLRLTVPERFDSYGRNDDVTIVLTFSGGGTRAAAFAYGVMKGLKQQQVQINSQNTVSLLSLVDVISSVSGGSFTSAYYGLFGDRLFTDFEQDFLKANIQSQLTRRWLINPVNWFRFMSGQFNRSDLTAQYYQDTIFANKTFADMRPDAPAIMINATDMATGTGFTFADDHFRWLCSDLGSFPVGKAVTASSAVPVVFSPVLIKNHPGCQPYAYQLSQVHDDVRYKTQALKLRQYQNKEQHPYLHLVDGGVVDNLGVRAVLNQVYEQDNDFWQTLKTYRLTNTKRVLFIIVNAAATLDTSLSQSQESPSLTQTLNAVTTIQSQNYNADTLDLLEMSTPRWAEHVRSGRCQEFFKAGCDDFEFYVTELNFTHMGEPAASELANIETALQLPSDQVEQLISAGELLVSQSPQIQDFIESVQNR